MSRLKHPIRSLKEPFGKAGLTVAILALVLAMVGGAYAAGGLTKAQEKQVTKIAKKYAGKPGAVGSVGPAGTPGKEGLEGLPGKPGKEGKEGKEGSPWTAGGSLPKGSTETGTWSASGMPVPFFGGLFHVLLSSISFPIPLEAGLHNESECDESGKPACLVHVIGPEGGQGEQNEAPAVKSGECTGAVSHPGAAAGNACIFVSALHENLKEIKPTRTGDILEANGAGAGPGGSVLFIKAEEGTSPVLVSGTWAVTAG